MDTDGDGLDEIVLLTEMGLVLINYNSSLDTFEIDNFAWNDPIFSGNFNSMPVLTHDNVNTIYLASNTAVYSYTLEYGQFLFMDKYSFESSIEVLAMYQEQLFGKPSLLVVYPNIIRYTILDESPLRWYTLCTSPHRLLPIVKVDNIDLEGEKEVLFGISHPGGVEAVIAKWNPESQSWNLIGITNYEHFNEIYNIDVSHISTAPHGTIVVSGDSGLDLVDISFEKTESTLDTLVYPATYAWEVGLGVTIAGQNPIHYYPEAGVHTIRLTVTDSDGDTDTITREAYIIVEERLPVADFSVNATTITN